MNLNIMKEILTERPPKVAVAKDLKKWLVTMNLNIEEVTDEYSCDSFTIEVDHRPTIDDVRDAIIAHIDAETDEKILCGYEWTVRHGDDAGKTVKVWLSSENQNNFKAKHDAAITYPDKVKFPVTYKISQDSETGNAIYEEFADIEELATFYLGGLDYIENCVNAGWRKKDAIGEWLKDVDL